MRGEPIKRTRCRDRSSRPTISISIKLFWAVRKMIRIAFSAAFALLGVTGSFAQLKLPTVDEALEVSAKTGRPIFAMAGQKT